MGNESSFGWLATLLCVLSVLVGLLFGHYLYPVEKQVIVEKPGAVQVVEVPRVETTVVYDESQLEQAKIDFLEEVDDTRSLLKCRHDEYDISQLTVDRVENYRIEKTHRQNDGEYTVFFEARVKYLDSDVEDKCYRDFKVEVTYDNDHEEPEVDIDY